MTLSRIMVIGPLALLSLQACSNSDLDWDLRRGTGADTSEAALQTSANRPGADGRGVISYPGYQVAVAQRGDTVGSIANRIGINADELARYNALRPSDSLREGEVLALPGGNRAGGPGTATGGIIGGGISGGGISGGGGPVDVSTIATTALDRVGTAPQTTAARPAGTTPTQHKVQRGETAFSIARTYNVSARSLADWNGLGTDLEVREGQVLIIPTATGTPPDPGRTVIKMPGVGSDTPQPPSAKKPLPAEKPAKAADKAKQTPPVADLGKDRTAASASKFSMPVNGKIIRGYAKKKNEGIDIAAAAGTAVKSAADGSVAVVTVDTKGTAIVVIRHADNLLTVYGGVANAKVKKGDKVSRGQSIAVIGAGDPAFLHFEIRNGADSLDPMTYLQ